METYPTALILGLAASGEAAARLLLAEGTTVRVVDQNNSDVLRRRAMALEAFGAQVSLGQSDVPDGPYSVCVISPGIPVDADWVRSIQRRGIPIISELELGWSRAVCRVLAVSGSNGKSTLVKLCAAALTCAGRRVAVAGNYGPPVSQVVMERRDWDWLVIEASSFQLETVRAFRPDIAVLLNVFPNHLDRHGEMAVYERLKARLFCRMGANNVGVVPDVMAAKIARLAASSNQWVTFGISPAADFCCQAGIVTNRRGKRVLSLKDTPFANEVLGVTGAAAAAAMNAGGESMEALQRAVDVYQPLPHRMQEVTERRRVRFVDDSKATNLAAMMAALQMSPKPIRLIAGGLPKHESYAAAGSLLAEKVVAVYLIGTAAEIMLSAWHNVAPCRLSRTLEQAVRSAWAQSHPGDTILLSPACASFDQFSGFEDRGNRFADIIRSLDEKKNA